MNQIYRKAIVLLCLFSINLYTALLGGPYFTNTLYAQQCGAQLGLPADVRYAPQGFLNDEINTGFVASGTAPLTVNSFAVPVSASGRVVGCAVPAKSAMINGNSVFIFDNVFVTRAEDCYAANFFGFAPSTAETQACQADVGQTEGLNTTDNTGTNNYEGFYYVIYDPANGGSYFRADNGGIPFDGTNVTAGFFGPTSNEVPPTAPPATVPNNSVIVDATVFSSLAAATGNVSGLPVELTAFTGYARGKTIELIWSTASESNNAGFEVERLHTDGSFRLIGEVSGHGTTSEAQNYRYVDVDPTVGLNVFRLRQQDYNGNQSFSPVITVSFGASPDNPLSVYPNPATGPITVAWRGAWTPKQQRLTDATGRIIRQDQLAGESEWSLATAGLAPGIYSLTLSDGQHVASRRVIVKQ